jgi:DNA (cytosine-5)-methyltransferase 1
MQLSSFIIDSLEGEKFVGNVVSKSTVITTKHIMKINNRPLGIDLFAGAGGMSLGFEQAGFDVVTAVEIDPVHSAIHEFNFPDCAVLCNSIVNVKSDDIRHLSTVGNKEIDVVFGGPPCQGFSLMGKRALDDPRNSLMFHFVRLVLELQPKYFVLENVKGLTLGEHRKFIDEVIQSFQEGGYEVVEKYQVLNAADFGVPQDRRRLFLLGNRKGLDKPNYPSTSVIQAKARDRNVPVLFNTPMGPTVWDAIGDLPNADDFEELLNTDSTTACYGDASEYARKLRNIETNEDDFSHPRIFDQCLLTSSMRTIHTRESMDRFESTSHGKIEPISRFVKLDPNGICNTLRAGTGSDKGAYSAPRPIHPIRPRCITVREAARLHSYPDWFRLHATKWHGFRQIGNSVPPLLARAVASEIIRVLKVNPVKPTKSMSLGEERLITLNMSEASRRFDVDRTIMGARLRKEIEIQPAVTPIPACI